MQHLFKDMQLYNCPVCENRVLKTPAYDNSGSPSFQICPECGFCFGIDDGQDRIKNFELWRQQYLRLGWPRFSSDSAFQNLVNESRANGRNWALDMSQAILPKPVLLTDAREEQVWNWVDENIVFLDVDALQSYNAPSPFAVYSITNMNNSADINLLFFRLFQSLTHTKEPMYALEWQSSSYFFYPHEPPVEKIWRHKGRDNLEFVCYFPQFIPDGDFYLFFASDFRFGYIGHPWREEIMIFGSELIAKFPKIATELGWRQVYLSL